MPSWSCLIELSGWRNAWQRLKRAIRGTGISVTWIVEIQLSVTTVANSSIVCELQSVGIAQLTFLAILDVYTKASVCRPEYPQQGASKCNAELW